MVSLRSSHRFGQLWTWLLPAVPLLPCIELHRTGLVLSSLSVDAVCRRSKDLIRLSPRRIIAVRELDATSAECCPAMADNVDGRRMVQRSA